LPQPGQSQRINHVDSGIQVLCRLVQHPQKQNAALSGAQRGVDALGDKAVPLLQQRVAQFPLAAVALEVGPGGKRGGSTAPRATSASSSRWLRLPAPASSSTISRSCPQTGNPS